jgi:hypothetical protein
MLDKKESLVVAVVVTVVLTNLVFMTLDLFD